MDNIKVSVVIPAYNVASYISVCLDSLIAQNYNEMEVIIVDDASTDDTTRIIREYSQKCSRIKLLIHEENMGVAESRNDGIRVAKGEYIYNLDSDDYIKEGTIKKLYTIASDNNLDVLSFSGEAFVDDSLLKAGEAHHYAHRVDSYIRYGQYGRCVSGPELFAQFLDNGDPIGNWCLHFIRREVFVENNLFINPDYGFDEDDLFPTYLVCNRAMCIKEVFYYRRYREGSVITTKRNMRKAENIMLRMEEDLKLWQEAGLPKELNNRLKKYFLLSHKAIMNMIHGMDDIEINKEYEILEKYPMAKYIMDHFILCKSKYKELSEKILLEMRDIENIVLYGAGVTAEDVASLLENHMITHYIVSVSKKENEQQLFHGKRVYERDELKIPWEKTWAIVAFDGRAVQKEIKDILIQKGCSKVLVANI